MAWDQVEPTPAHVSYLTLSLFLIGYTLFTSFIRNRLHLSEPPIALIVGIILGPRALAWLTPNFAGVNGPQDDKSADWLGGWGWGDDVGEYYVFIVILQWDFVLILYQSRKQRE